MRLIDADALWKDITKSMDEGGEMIEDYITIEANYCPVCGRKLENER